MSAVYGDKKIVFELQLTTTFLSVISERNTFYENNKTFIIWLFDNKRKNIQNMRFMEKDIFYPNHHNAFFIDEISGSNDFKLVCGYEKPILNNGCIENIWKIKRVDFSELTFGDNFRIYWFDYEKELENVKENLKSIKLSEFEKIWKNSKNIEDRINAINCIKKLFESDSADINNFELIELVNCLYSIKFKKVVGYKYTKLIQLLHQFFQKDMGAKKHFGEYVLKAIGTYGAKQQVLKEDKTGKFVDKARLYVKYKFDLSHKYDRILQSLFPELFKN